MRSLGDILQCIVCLGTVQPECVMCPRCRKLFCAQCVAPGGAALAACPACRAAGWAPEPAQPPFAELVRQLRTEPLASARALAALADEDRERRALAAAIAAELDAAPRAPTPPARAGTVRVRECVELSAARTEAPLRSAAAGAPGCVGFEPVVGAGGRVSFYAHVDAACGARAYGQLRDAAPPHAPRTALEPFAAVSETRAVTAWPRTLAAPPGDEPLRAMLVVWAPADE